MRRGRLGAFALVLLALLASAPAAPAEGGFGVSPARIAFGDVAPGDARTQTLRVSNGFDVGLDVALDLGDLAPLLHAEPASFRLAPGADRLVTLDLRVPADAPPYPYAGHVRVVAAPIEAPDGTGSALRHAVGVAVGARVGDVPLASLRVVPETGSVTADARTPTRYSVEGVDEAGKVVPVPSQFVRWTATPATAGSWSGDTFTPGTAPGLVEVRATLLGGPAVQGTGALRIQPGDPARLEIGPAEARVAVGQRVAYAARAFDAHGNRVPLPPLAWTTDPTFVASFESPANLLAVRVGDAVVAAASERFGLRATAALVVGSTARPIAEVRIAPASAVVTAGERVEFQATAYDAAGEPVPGAAFAFRVENASQGDVSATGLFAARRAGNTTVVASAGDASAQALVQVVPGPLARLALTPASAAVTEGSEVRFVATGLDAQGNVLPAPAVAWRATGGAVTGDGRFTAPGPGSFVVRATSGAVSREAVVHVFAAGATGGGEVTPTTLSSSDGAGEATTYVSAMPRVDPGVGTVIRSDDAGSDGGRLTQAVLDVERSASNVALSLDVQAGSLEEIPPEIDPGELAAGVDAASGEEPALFLTVRASEDGEELDAGRLNALVSRLEVQVDVPEEAFTRNGLDPTRVRVLEFSSGRLVRDDLPAALLTPRPVDGWYTFLVVLEDFSSFAFVAEPPEPEAPAPEPPARSGGGGGGGGGGGEAPPPPPEEPVVPQASVRLDGADRQSCARATACRARSWTVLFASNVVGLDASRPWTYAWDLGDGASSTAPAPEHRYDARGVFRVRLRVTDGAQEASATQDVLVAPPLAVRVERLPGAFRVEFWEEVRRADALLGPDLLRAYPQPGDELLVDDPRTAGDGRTLLLDVTDRLGDVHHVVLPAIGADGEPEVSVAEPVAPTAGVVPGARVEPAGDPVAPRPWALAGVAAVLAGILGGAWLARRSLRLQDEDDADPPWLRP